MKNARRSFLSARSLLFLCSLLIICFRQKLKKLKIQRNMRKSGQCLFCHALFKFFVFAVQLKSKERADRKLPITHHHYTRGHRSARGGQNDDVKRAMPNLSSSWIPKRKKFQVEYKKIKTFFACGASMITLFQFNLNWLKIF